MPAARELGHNGVDDRRPIALVRLPEQALGVPVWTLLPHRADWRWMEERDDSPWYPTPIERPSSHSPACHTSPTRSASLRGSGAGAACRYGTFAGIVAGVVRNTCANSMISTSTSYSTSGSPSCNGSSAPMSPTVRSRSSSAGCAHTTTSRAMRFSSGR